MTRPRRRRAAGPVMVALLLGSAALGGGGSQEREATAGPCRALKLPAGWDVRSSAYADVTGDGSPECVLSVWRPWADWPIARWSSRPTPIKRNRDARGDSAHIAVLRPLPGGAFRNVWVGSALFQPVTALAVLPDGTLATLETTYARGRQASSVALSLWHWTGFGFGLVQRRTVRATTLQVGADGVLVAR